jgi:Lipase (class 3)
MSGPPFSAVTAELYGSFVVAAYTMYTGAPTNLRPPPSTDFPTGYALSAWVQMQDFILDSLAPVFYGFIAHSNQPPDQAVLAIRGTSNGVEWWDDANSLGMTPFPVQNCGNVGLGFEKIYATMEVVEAQPAAAALPSLRGVGSFSAQVAEHLKRRARATARVPATASPPPIVVAGHSLGAALATYYAAENALVHKIQNPGLWTFASPKVGDQGFVDAFNRLGLTSWRIVNKQDIVPHLPPGLFYKHVDTEELYDSQGVVQPSFGCWHSLATYLHLLNASYPLDAGCGLSAV